MTMSDDDDLPPPTGTMFLLGIFMAVLAGMWGAMYLMLLSR